MFYFGDFDGPDDIEFEELYLFFNKKTMEFGELSRKISSLDYDTPVHAKIGDRLFRVTHIPPQMCLSESIVFGAYYNTTFCDEFHDIETMMKEKGYALWEIRYKTHELVFTRIKYRRNTVNLDIFEEDE